MYRGHLFLNFPFSRRQNDLLSGRQVVVKKTCLLLLSFLRMVSRIKNIVGNKRKCERKTKHQNSFFYVSVASCTTEHIAAVKFS